MRKKSVPRGAQVVALAPAEPLLTHAEACDYLGVTRHTLDRWRDKGMPDGRRVVGLKLATRWRYRKSDLDALLVPTSGPVQD